MTPSECNWMPTNRWWINWESSINNTQQWEGTNWWCRLFYKLVEWKHSVSKGCTHMTPIMSSPDQSSAYYNVLRLIDLYTSVTHESQYYNMQIKNMTLWLFGSQGILLWTTKQTLEWSLILDICSPGADNTDVLPPDCHWCHERASNQWGPGSCRLVYMLAPGLDLAKRETSFSGESIQLGSREYPSAGENSSVVDLEGQGEPYILQTRKTGFKVLSWYVDPETRTQAMGWLTLIFFLSYTV